MPNQELGGSLRLLVGVGAIEGAAGVALAAVAAHAVPSQALGSAATLLMAHAGIVVGLALIAARSHRRLARLLTVPAALIALGAGTFGLAVALRVLGGIAPPTGMAPVGGTLTILGWLALLGPVLFGGRTGEGKRKGAEGRASRS